MARGQKSKVSLVEDVVNEAVERIQTLTEEREGEASRLTQERLNQGEGQSPLEEDIFDEGTKLVMSGVPVQYYLYLNGELKGVVPHPFSWEQVIKKQLPGIWKIQAKNAATKSFLKQQTKTVGDDIFSESHAQDFALGGADLPPVENIPPPGPLDILEVMRKMQSENEERQSQKTSQLMGTITGLMTAAAPLLAKLFEKKDDKTELLIEMMREDQRRAREESQRTYDRLEAKLSQPAKPETNPFEFLKQLQDAEDRGFQRSREFFELIDDKAEAKAQTLLEKMSDRDEPESMTDSILKAFLPVVAQGLGKAAESQAALPPAPVTAQRAQPPLRVVPSTSQPRPTPAPRQAGTITAVAVSASAKPIGQTSVQKPSPVLQPEQKAPPENKETPPVKPPVTEAQLEALRKALLDYLFPIVKKELAKTLLGVTPRADVAAQESLKALAVKGVKPEQVKGLISLEYLQKVVSGYNLPESVKPWFNEYYAYLTTHTGNDDRGATGA